ncbi:protease inhibitor-like [Drosophila hydei]|uniref:Protease inhibitor-like n=1 Tax=Drosophila hydei TaxID=7224 RepID=A0A6J1M675_DROHY|nr:protease inhibitor-like [Drosophila hydei]
MRRFNQVLSLLMLGFIALFINGTDGIISMRCFKRPNVGPSCGKRGLYFNYEVVENMCRGFIYTGCNTEINTDENRFETVEDCEDTCLMYQI